MTRHLKLGRRRFWAVVIIFGTVLSLACGPASSGTVSDPTALPADPTALPVDPEVSAQNQYVDPYPEPSASQDTPKDEAKAKRAPGPMAAELAGIANWINSEPLTIEGLRGKVVLVDFWTYTCINCIRTFPFLREWNARYSDQGLVILGVHTPEFEFEKDYDNVVQATLEHEIVWPVAQDNDYETWNNFSNRSWPAKYLIDKDGVLRYAHFGEGKYAETELKIQELLMEIGSDFSGTTLELPEDQKLDTEFRKGFRSEITPELYAGYGRNFSAIRFGGDPYIRQKEFFEGVDKVVDFEAPEELIPGKIYFHGTWRIEEERSKHGRETTNYEDYIELYYSAVSVNVVLTSDSGEPYKVRLTVGGEYLTDANKGQDVIIGEDGESYILITEPRLYTLLENPSYVRREALRLSSNSDDFGIFAFTFGIYEEGP